MSSLLLHFFVNGDQLAHKGGDPVQQQLPVEREPSQLHLQALQARLLLFGECFAEFFVDFVQLGVGLVIGGLGLLIKIGLVLGERQHGHAQHETRRTRHNLSHHKNSLPASFRLLLQFQFNAPDKARHHIVEGRHDRAADKAAHPIEHRKKKHADPTDEALLGREARIFGVSHDALGAALCESWGLGAVAVASVRHHVTAQGLLVLSVPPARRDALALSVLAEALMSSPDGLDAVVDAICPQANLDLDLTLRTTRRLVDERAQALRNGRAA